MQVRKRFRFEAAHVLPNHPGKCGRLHGHSYKLDVTVEGALATGGAAAGMVLDFDELSAVVRREVIDVLDHSYLNDLMANPTAELIARWIWLRLDPLLSDVCEVVVWETENACAIVRRPDFA